MLRLVDDGDGSSGWVTLRPDLPFSSLVLTERPGNVDDQYFGNVLATTVPEPGSLSPLMLGLAGVGGLLGRRRFHLGA